jgi:hypothetical protein
MRASTGRLIPVLPPCAAWTEVTETRTKANRRSIVGAGSSAGRAQQASGEKLLRRFRYPSGRSPLCRRQHVLGGRHYRTRRCLLRPKPWVFRRPASTPRRSVGARTFRADLASGPSGASTPTDTWPKNAMTEMTIRKCKCAQHGEDNRRIEGINPRSIRDAFQQAGLRSGQAVLVIEL